MIFFSEKSGIPWNCVSGWLAKNVWATMPSCLISELWLKLCKSQEAFSPAACYSLSVLPENWRTENMREKWKSFWHFWQLLLSILWWKMSGDAYRWWIAVSSGRAWKVKQCRCTKWKPWLFPVSFTYLQSKAKTSIYTSYHYTTSILFHADAVATEKEGHMSTLTGFRHKSREQ